MLFVCLSVRLVIISVIVVVLCVKLHKPVVKNKFPLSGVVRQKLCYSSCVKSFQAAWRWMFRCSDHFYFATTALAVIERSLLLQWFLFSVRYLSL